MTCEKRVKSENVLCAIEWALVFMGSLPWCKRSPGVISLAEERLLIRIAVMLMGISRKNLISFFPSKRLKTHVGKI